MDWAEELKMSIRKTTARKGRRSKSRDVLKDSAQTSSSVTSNSTEQFANNPELSLDIGLNIQSQQSRQPSSSTSNNIQSSPLASGNLDVSSLLDSSTDSKRPPALRRISGGWADSAVGNKLKSKKSSFDDDRFGIKSSSATNSPSDEIPIIPDLDDIKDDILMNEIAEAPSIAVNRVVALKELNSDLLEQNAFSAIEEVDLSILTKCLQPQELLDEADEVWEWDKLFTDVVAEINGDKPLERKMKSLELRPDELPKPSE